MDQNVQITQVCCFSKRLLYLRRYVFDLLPRVQYLKHFFHLKIHIFVTLKSDQDPH
jgi:hypothetical protein